MKYRISLLSFIFFSSIALSITIEDLPKIEYEKFTLDNGLTVIVHEDKKVPMVAVNVWYHVGSKNEKPGKSGFAHLFRKKSHIHRPFENCHRSRLEVEELPHGSWG